MEKPRWSDKEQRRYFFANCLKPLSNKNIPKYDFVGFDVETYGDTNEFYLGGIYYYKGKTEKIPTYEVFYDREEMIQYLFSKKFCGKYIVATNLDFDLNRLFWDTPHYNKLNILERQGNTIYAEYRPKHYNKWGKIMFIDTTNYVFFSVKKMGELLGKPKIQSPSCWKRITNEKGELIDYDVQTPKNEKEKKELEEYNKRDCEISCDFMYFLQKGFNEAGGKLKMTIASTAFDVWRRNFLKQILIKESYLLKQNNIKNLIFDGYYGGRTECFTRGTTKDVYYYDVNSLYPAVMKQEYPNPNTARKPRYNTLSNIRRFEGTSTVTVRTPKKMNRPFLPHRHDNKLVFPLGEWKATYNHNELREAMKLGYTIKEVHDQIIYMETFTPFKEFVDYYYNKRLEYKKEKSPMELPMKLIMNSLYGKFGQKKIRYTEVLDTEHATYEQIMEHCVEGKTELKQDRYLMTVREKDYNGKNQYPILASYTTSKARILMYHYLKDEKVIYTDTDSIVTTTPLDHTSDRLGEMKLEGTFREATIIRPKLYRLIGYDGEYHIRAKGINHPNNDDFDNIINNISVHKKKLSKPKESLRRGLDIYSKQTIEKHITLDDDKRVWSDDNTSEPLIL